MFFAARPWRGGGSRNRTAFTVFSAGPAKPLPPRGDTYREDRLNIAQGSEAPQGSAADLKDLGRGAVAPRYIAGFDGLRAIAVLMVLVSHVGYGRIVPGGLGVTIFFAISGFLITTLLIDETAVERGNAPLS